MPTRRTFLTTATAATAIPALAENSPLFSFGLMADCQYADADTRGSRFYRESPKKLEAAVKQLNERELAFTFHLGDFIDRDFASFDVLEPIAAKLDSQLFHALGNHDFDVKDQEKPKVLGKLGLKEEGYYSFRKSGFRFIVIDTTEVSPYRYATGSPESKAASAELKKNKAEKVPGSNPWNGRPGDAQIAWLKGELETASSEQEKVLLLGHHPILPLEGHAMWNATEISDLLQQHSSAKLYLNGHNHAGHYIDKNGFHYLTLNGMLETKDTNAFAVVDVFSDRLEIKGFGRQGSHTLKFRA